MLDRRTFAAGIARLTELLQARPWTTESMDLAYSAIAPSFTDVTWHARLAELARTAKSYGGQMLAPSEILGTSQDGELRTEAADALQRVMALGRLGHVDLRRGALAFIGPTAAHALAACGGTWMSDDEPRFARTFTRAYVEARGSDPVGFPQSIPAQRRDQVRMLRAAGSPIELGDGASPGGFPPMPGPFSIYELPEGVTESDVEKNTRKTFKVIDEHGHERYGERPFLLLRDGREIPARPCTALVAVDAAARASDATAFDRKLAAAVDQHASRSGPRRLDVGRVVATLGDGA